MSAVRPILCPVDLAEPCEPAFQLACAPVAGPLAQNMVDAHIHRVLVVTDQNRPRGIVTSTDILAAVGRAAPERRPGRRTANRPRGPADAVDPVSSRIAAGRRTSRSMTLVPRLNGPTATGRNHACGTTGGAQTP
jgi:hypothetical protein